MSYLENLFMKKLVLVCLSILLLLLTACHPTQTKLEEGADFITQLESYETVNVDRIGDLVEITEPMLNISAKTVESFEGWEFFGPTHAQKEISIFGYVGLVSITMKSGRVKAVSYFWTGTSATEHYSLADTLINDYGDPLRVQLKSGNTTTKEATQKEIGEYINNGATDDYFTSYQWDVEDSFSLMTNYLAKSDYVELNLASQK